MKTVSVPRVSYSTSYRPVHTVRAVTSYKPVRSYQQVTEYQTETSFQPQLTKQHSTAQVQVAVSKGRRILNPVSKSSVALSKISAVPVTKTVSVPRVSFSKSYRPVQAVRAITSYKPVVSYRPVTEYHTETSYQPQLTKHHSTPHIQVASSKGHRLFYPVPKGSVGVSKITAVPVTTSFSIPRVSYSKSYRPVQTVRAVTAYKPVVSYKPVTEYRTETSYQAQLNKHHSTEQVQVQVAPLARLSSKGF